MRLFGLTYTDTGFSIHAHFPFFFRDNSSPDHGAETGHWGARSVLLSDTYANTFQVEFDARGRAIPPLLRIQSHMRWALEELQQWDGYERCLKRLLICNQH